MDFRTEWWSKILVILMIVIAIVINPWSVPSEWALGNTLYFIGQSLLYPFVAIALATIPVLIGCWIMKKEPDLDYSIWVAFTFMLYLLVKFFI